MAWCAATSRTSAGCRGATSSSTKAQNIKNPLTKQARAVRRIGSGYRLALTGTPIENRLSELWSIMTFLLPGYLGSLDGFRREFALPIERYQDEEAAERLRRLVRPFVLRRLKTDPLVIQICQTSSNTKVYCNLTREQVTLTRRWCAMR